VVITATTVLSLLPGQLLLVVPLVRIQANVTAVSGQRDRTASRRGTGASFLLRAVTFGQGGAVGEFGVGASLSHRAALQ